MDIDSLTDDQLDQLASKLAGRLPTGRHGDKSVTTRRQLLATAAGGSAGVAALVRLGIDPATAQQAAGQVGTPSSPEDAHLADVEAQSVSTVSALIGGHDQINGVEFGVVSHDAPGTSSTDDFADSSEDIKSITFSTSFDSTPIVVNGLFNAEGHIGYVAAVSTTGMNLIDRNYKNGNNFGPDHWWLAIE